MGVEACEKVHEVLLVKERKDLVEGLEIMVHDGYDVFDGRKG